MCKNIHTTNYDFGTSNKETFNVSSANQKLELSFIKSLFLSRLAHLKLEYVFVVNILKSS